jgi:hypothetical protein
MYIYSHFEERSSISTFYLVQTVATNFLGKVMSYELNDGDKATMYLLIAASLLLMLIRRSIFLLKSLLTIPEL